MVREMVRENNTGLICFAVTTLVLTLIVASGLTIVEPALGNTHFDDNGVITGPSVSVTGSFAGTVTRHHLPKPVIAPVASRPASTMINSAAGHSPKQASHNSGGSKPRDNRIVTGGIPAKWIEKQLASIATKPVTTGNARGI